MNNVDSVSSLDKILQALSRKKNIYLLLNGLSLSAIVLFMSVGAALLLSLLYENPYFYALLKILVLLATVFTTIKFLLLPFVKKHSALPIIEELDNVSESLGEETLSAIELNRNINNHAELGTSRQLALAHIDKITKRLANIDLSSFYSLKNLQNKFIFSAVGMVFGTLVIIFVPGNFTNYLFSLNLGPANTNSELKLANVEITLEYPEYTNLNPKTIKATKGQIDAMKGTKLKFQAEPVGHFNKGALMVENGISVPVINDNGKIWAEFTLLASSSFVIKETDQNLRSEVYIIQVAQDNDPVVKITSPLGDVVELGAEEKMDIFYEAEDDYQISKLALSWENQRSQSELPIKTENPNSSSMKGKLTWGPSGIDPGNGDTIKLRVFAYDNDTISGPKVGVSNSITVKLKDAKSKHKETMNLAEQLMEELIDILGDEINISEVNNGLTNDTSSSKIIDQDEIIKEQKSLTRKIENASTTLETTISSMKEDEYSDFTSYVALSNMKLRINALLGERKHIVETLAKIDLLRLGMLMNREISEFEDDILFLDSLIKGNQLMDSLLSSRELLSEYSELAELLKNADNQALNQEIEEKLDQIKDLMSELAEKMADLGGDIQEGFLNQDAFEAMNMQSQLDQISKLAQEGKIQEALEMLANMSQSIQNMMASLENGMQSFASSMMNQGASELNELISRIEEIEKEESELRDDTGKLKESLLNNPDSNTGNLRKFVDEQIKKTKQMSNELEQAKAKIVDDPKNSQNAHLIDRMLDRSQQLQNWLEAMDLRPALKSAKSIEESTKGLKEMASQNFANFGKATTELSSSNKLAEEIRKDLNELLENSGKTGGQFGEMALRQDGIEEKTSDLIKELSSEQSGLFLPPGMNQNLDQAKRFMGNASQDLRDELISKAISNEDEALKALRSAKEQAQEMMKQMQMSASGKGMSAPMMLGRQMQSGGTQGADTRYVEIPQATEDIGKEYKKRILDAMKGGSPEGYIELNKKYYDRIIK